eukprot:jgi/Chlat1/7817/Chrsp66S07272
MVGVAAQLVAVPTVCGLPPPARAAAPRRCFQQGVSLLSQKKVPCLRMLPRGNRASAGAVHAALGTADILQAAAAVPPVLRDTAATVSVAVGALLWVKIFDALARRKVLDQKLSRKLVHITSGPLLMLCWPFFSEEPYARCLAALVPAANALRLASVGLGWVDNPDLIAAVTREGDRRELLRGPLYYCIVLASATMIFWRGSPIGVTALSMMCGGDGLADIVGRRFGSVKLPFSKTKSYAGSLAMLLGGLLMAWGFVHLYTSLGYFPSNSATIVGLLETAIVATIAEVLPVNDVVDDNISVPTAAVLAGFVALQ